MNKDNIDNIIKLEACCYTALGSNSIVINPAEIGHCIWIHLDPSTCRLHFIDATEIASKKLLHEGAVERDREGDCWLKVFSQELDLSVGYHAYKLRFCDKDHHIGVFKYIAYTVQTEDVPKPYIYMNRQEQE